MDWILNRCTESMGVTVGSTRITDQAYADDGCSVHRLPVQMARDTDHLRCCCRDHGTTYIRAENEDSEYWPRYTAIFSLHAGQWTNSRSSRSVSISWQYYQFRWTINAGNTSSDWFLRHHGQIVQCVAAIQTQPGDQVESLQLTCPVSSPVWM